MRNEERAHSQALRMREANEAAKAVNTAGARIEKTHEKPKKKMMPKRKKLKKKPNKKLKKTPRRS